MGFDDKILSLYAHGMTVREIQQHLIEMYGVDVSPSLISTVTAELELSPLNGHIMFCLKKKKDDTTL